MVDRFSFVDRLRGENDNESLDHVEQVDSFRRRLGFQSHSPRFMIPLRRGAQRFATRRVKNVHLRRDLKVNRAVRGLHAISWRAIVRRK